MKTNVRHPQDPCIYDSTGTLLTLLHWRKPSRAYWVPLLDTKLLQRLASGRKKENYFPVAVADQKFHCIILKGGDQYPYFPRPLLSEFDFSVPLTSAPAGEKKQKKKKSKKSRADGDLDLDEEMADGSSSEGDAEDSDAEAAGGEAESEPLRLTQAYLLKTLQAAQLADVLDSSSSSSSASGRAGLARLELDIDKTLLQLLAIECREGEERSMRALEVVQLMRDRTGRMVEAAGKVAERYGRGILGEKIREVGERRVAERNRGRAGSEDEESDGDFA